MIRKMVIVCDFLAILTVFGSLLLASFTNVAYARSTASEGALDRVGELTYCAGVYARIGYSATQNERLEVVEAIDAAFNQFQGDALELTSALASFGFISNVHLTLFQNATRITINSGWNDAEAMTTEKLAKTVDHCSTYLTIKGE